MTNGGDEPQAAERPAAIHASCIRGVSLCVFFSLLSGGRTKHMDTDEAVGWEMVSWQQGTQSPPGDITGVRLFRDFGCVHAQT